MWIFPSFSACSKLFVNSISLEQTISFHFTLNKVRKFHQITNTRYKRSQEKSTVNFRRYLSGKCSVQKPPWRILFFGSDAFAVSSLQALCSKFRTDTFISRLDVCTNSALDWNHKHNPVYEFAQKENLNLHEWPLEDHEFVDRYDVGVVVSFGYLIPKEIIDALPLGILNVHGSLLPRWRGAAPIMRAIMNGDTETGVTIMKISPHKFDVGDIVRQYGVRIYPDETAVALTNRLAELGAGLLMECIRDLPRSVQYSMPQSKENASYAKKITQSTAIVKWTEKTAEDVYNLYRAISHVFPLTTYWFDLPIKLLDVRLDEVSEMNPANKKNVSLLKTDESIFPGLVEYSRRRSLLRIQCKDGKWICVNSVIVSGKKTVSAADFYNGFISKKKNSLERKFTS